MVKTDTLPYECKLPWPENCLVQGGEDVVVFFEAFPRDQHVNTFIRGEGRTMAVAEIAAWTQYQRFCNCSVNHEDKNDFDPSGYTNGAGFCKKCGMFKSHCFEPTEICVSCGENTYHAKDKRGNWWCKECYDKILEEDRP